MHLLITWLFLLYVQQVFSQITCSNTTLSVDTDIEMKNATYAPNQDCMFTINFANDTTVFIRLTVDNQENMTTAHLWNDYGNEFEYSPTGVWVDVFWPPPVAYFRFTTGSSGNVSMSLSIVPRKLHIGVDTTSTLLKSGDQPLVYNNMTDNSTYVFTSDTKVVLAAAYFQDLYCEYYMNFFVYEGIDEGRKFIGTLYNMVNTRNYISSGKTLTIYVVQNNLREEWERIIVNDYGNVANFNGNCDYRWSWFAGDSWYQVVSIDSTKGPATLSILNDQSDERDEYQRWPTIVDIVFSDSTSTMRAYSGLPTSNMTAYYITEYSALDTKSRLSQLFPGEMLTFVLEKGTAAINFTYLFYYREASDWGAARDRKGVFLSNMYGFEWNEARTMNYTVKQDFGHYDWVRLNLQVGSDFSSNNSWISYRSANLTDYGNTTTIYAPCPMNISLIGQQFEISINSGDAKSFGQIVHFEMHNLKEEVSTSTVSKSITNAASTSTMSTKTVTTTPTAPTTGNFTTMSGSTSNGLSTGVITSTYTSIGSTSKAAPLTSPHTDSTTKSALENSRNKCCTSLPVFLSIGIVCLIQ